MIAEREIVDIKPFEKAPTTVEERPAIAVNLLQPEWSDKLFIASNICLLAGLLVMAIALMLPVGMLSTVLITFPMSVTFSLALLVTEVSLFVVGAVLFDWALSGSESNEHKVPDTSDVGTGVVWMQGGDACVVLVLNSYKPLSNSNGVNGL